ncbi:winged helix-turn-helix domain-containing protein [Naasia lichenicola]|uniref:Winged helix-turn-helix transcriptional regulator n=1 Tax=Naasia lichenicola TaxID=2565933 RepID=A0A4S4FKV0_9MICO|nr:winged helix-turn-helix domain-containing protein [Naasia lichenicola]THG31073.1 winged helix-turn-helix transcriptional regulator [Naasia lichenicola]
MSIAPLDRPRTFRPTAVPPVSAVSTPEADQAPAPRLRVVADGVEARGFVLYVGVDEAKALAAGTSLGSLVEALKRVTAEHVAAAETYAAVALAPKGAGGRDVDVVRLALQDPAALAKHRVEAEEPEGVAARGIVIDISRKRVVLDDEVVPLTYKEFELLQYLVLREGRTIERAQIIESLWQASEAADGQAGIEIPNERTIDVHVRRLRAKLGTYENIVRTVRGVGYRFDRHADVVIKHPQGGPSPDRF